MPAYNASTSSTAASVSSGGAFKVFADEARELFKALMNPRKILADVEQMRALYNQAVAVELKDPARAARLRQQAGQIGLR